MTMELNMFEENNKKNTPPIYPKAVCVFCEFSFLENKNKKFTQ